MNSLILTFNKDQMQLYKELLTKENIELNFDAELPDVQKISLDYFDLEITNIEKEALKLLKFKKNGVLFSALTEEEVKTFIPVYYTTIRNIKQYTTKINSNACVLINQINEANQLITDINKRYADFLPYKAAFWGRDEYSTEISKIDEQFRQSIEIASNYKQEILELFEKAERIDNIVSDFFEKSSKATDEPKFKNFNYNDFFWSVEAFLERTKNVTNK